MRTISQVLLNFLANAAWQIILIAALASLCAWLLHNTVARHRHFVWVAALLLSISLPWFNGSRILTRESFSEPAFQPAPVESVATTVIDEEQVDSPPVVSTPWLGISQRIAIIIVLLYTLLLLYRVFKLAKAWQRTRAIRKSAYLPELNADAETIIEHCRASLGTVPCEIRVSPEVSVPLTVGIREPLVILPEKLLHEANSEVLTSAIGHELVHVQRRDYLLNLIYELIYLPLSFHPAAALMRRRINQTRELSCDELVTRKLLTAEIYAHSLVQLAGSAVPFSRHASLTVGITDADILEVRIMSILRKSKLSTGRARLLLIAASLLLAMPCVATAAFGLAFDITLQEPAFAKDEGSPKGILIYRTEPKYTDDAREKKIEGTVGLLASINSNGTVEHVQVTEPLYPSLDRSAVEALKKWRFAPLVRDGKPAAQQFHVEMLFSMNGYQEKRQPAKIEQDQKQSNGEKTEMERRREMEINEAQMRELKERAEHDLRFKAEYEEQWKRQTDSQYQAELAARDRRMEEERKAMAIANATLARTAKISMEQAIQIANGQYPGKVMECNLVGQGWESLGKLSKDGRVLYHVVIISSDENNPVFTHVWVNAVDGTIHKTEKAEGRNETRKAAPISGGILNGKAISMPVPSYPEVARNAHVSGAVMVQVLVDEGGNVISAHVVSGHPLLQAAAVDAARLAKFSPTMLTGEPVKVNGVLTYNFLAQ